MTLYFNLLFLKMDVILETADSYFLDDVYDVISKYDLICNSYLHRDSIFRQILSIYAITIIGGLILYFTFASLSYFLVFDHQLMKHPKYLKGQVWMEIKMSLKSFPWLALLTLPWFVGEVRGWSMLYKTNKYGYGYILLSVIGFIAFTDFGIYWVHRWLHHPLFYTRFHKPHHRWVVPTPFASHSFHPLDSYSQSVPYHIYSFLVPVNSYVFMILYILVNLWSISIHDGKHLMDNPFINSSSHHEIHHTEYYYNYGQYFTLWDRIGGSYKGHKGVPEKNASNGSINYKSE